MSVSLLQLVTKKFTLREPRIFSMWRLFQTWRTDAWKRIKEQENRQKTLTYFENSEKKAF